MKNLIILFFVLLFGRKIKIGFQRLRFFVCNCSTIVKALFFDVISLLGDLVIKYRTNLVVTVPEAVRTFHRILTMFTRIFRVKGGERFKATSLCFLTVVVFQCRCSSLGSQLQHHSQKPLPPPPPHPSPPNLKYPKNPPHYYSRYQ